MKRVRVQGGDVGNHQHSFSTLDCGVIKVVRPPAITGRGDFDFFDTGSCGLNGEWDMIVGRAALMLY